jgi:pyrrolidone-carboxylate peptidase
VTKSLLVGFNEFFDWRLNPARITVETIRSDAAFAAEVGLIAEVLPTEFDAAGRRVVQLINDIDDRSTANGPRQNSISVCRYAQLRNTFRNTKTAVASRVAFPIHIPQTGLMIPSRQRFIVKSTIG